MPYNFLPKFSFIYFTGLGLKKIMALSRSHQIWIQNWWKLWGCCRCCLRLLGFTKLRLKYCLIRYLLCFLQKLQPLGSTSLDANTTGGVDADPLCTQWFIWHGFVISVLRPCFSRVIALLHTQAVHHKLPQSKLKPGVITAELQTGCHEKH